MKVTKTENLEVYESMALMAQDYAPGCGVDMARMQEQVEQYARETPHRHYRASSTDQTCDSPASCARCALERVLRNVFKVTPVVTP